MKTFKHIVLGVLLLLPLASMAQYQLPDPGFEDWNGETFAGAIQPTHWNFCNVNQFSFDFNFAHRETGRSGYCAMVQDQAMKVGSIDGGTSPGYLALGHPWAYVPSLTNIPGSTAGCHGGISFVHRPDSVAVWIKRTGDHWADENYNIVYYGWKGTSIGTSYGNQGKTCTDITWEDEESDIRQALDANVCVTAQHAVQVCEAYLFERQQYPNWTRIVVPVYYLNDEVPEKCNLILSAGNYPAGRASDGLYDGNSLYVDDVELIYSSAIQKVYVNNREWKGFDPNNHGVQTYTVGQSVTSIPSFYCVRGAGRMTNNTGKSATFPGRTLSAQECVINTSGASIDGNPVVITVTSEDGLSTSTYQIQFVSQVSNNARLADLRVNGESVSGFNAYVTSYNVALPYGTTDVPVVTAEAQDANATVNITQPNSLTGTATVVVTAQDGTTTETYTLSFSEALLADATLQDILLDGVSLPGFVPAKSNYTVSVPLDATDAPQVTPVSAYPAGLQTITILKNNLTEGCQIQVVAPSGVSKTYKLTYRQEASTYSYLSAIMLDGVPLSDFEPSRLSYSISLPLGTTALPAITWTQGDAYQTVQLQEGGLNGTTRLVVRAAAGNTTTYRLLFETVKSSNNALSAIALDGEPLAAFHPDTLEYYLTLSAGTTALPVVSWTVGDAGQTVSSVINTALGTVRITVRAGDGSQRVYTLHFSVEKSASALLQMIYLDGDSLPGFLPDRMDYDLPLQEERIPHITVARSAGQTVSITSPTGFGIARIVVRPEEGTEARYSLTFRSANEPVLPVFPVDSLRPDTSAFLAGLLVDEQPLSSFQSDSFDYVVTLGETVHELPAVAPVFASALQVAAVHYPDSATAIVRVQATASDSLHAASYTIHFRPYRSSNSQLAAIELDGFDLSFSPTVTDYQVVLPYGTTERPEVQCEKGDAQQTLTLFRSDTLVRYTVLSGDSAHTTVYSIHLSVAPSQLPNRLINLVVDGFGLLTLTDQTHYTIDLPYGTRSAVVQSFTKAYPEQSVVVQNGMAGQPTSVVVYSDQPGEAPFVYTLTPRTAVADYTLASLSVNGAPVEGFAPDRTDYVISVTTQPSVEYTLTDVSATASVTSDFKHWACEVETPNGALTYNLWFYYASDIIPNADFSQTATAANNNAFKPAFWQVPADGAKSYSAFGTYTTGQEVTRASDGSINLHTIFMWNAIAGSIPGMMTLGTLHLSLGAGGSSKSSISGGIRFRNSPDAFLLDYMPVEATRTANWRFWAQVNGEEKLYTGSFDNLNTWQTARLNLDYQPAPDSLNILINSTYFDNADDAPGTAVDQAHSELHVRNLRAVYNSALSSLKVNGVAATLSGTSFSAATTNAEYCELPELFFTGQVPDQASVVTWSDWQNGVRTASIRNYAENPAYYTDYSLSFSRPLSTLDSCVCLLSGADLIVSPLSAYQTILVTPTDTAYLVDVTPESGNVRRFVVRRPQAQVLPADTSVSSPIYPTFVVPAESMVSYPEVLSTNALLSDLRINGATIDGFYSETFTYNISLASLASVEAVPEDANVKVQIVRISQDSVHTAIFVHVRAQSGDTALYAVEATHRTLRATAVLTSIMANDTLLPDFSSEKLTYDYQLPAGSSVPQLTSQVADGASVEVTTAPLANVKGLEFTFVVTSEDGLTQRTYTVRYTILPSEWASLSMIYIDNEPLAAFRPDITYYEVTIPIGATAYPVVTYDLGESHQQVRVSLPEERMCVLQSTAEDQLHYATYVVVFVAAKSSNSALASIMVDGDPLEGFSPDEQTYYVSLPYGTTALPDVQAVPADSLATLSQQAFGLDSLVLTVTAEDHSQSRYVLYFTIQNSTNARLQMLYLDGAPLPGFAPDIFAYDTILPYGASVPNLSWQLADEQQLVDSAFDAAASSYLLTVTSGSRDRVEEYEVHVAFRLSPVNALSDLRLDGQTLIGFDPNILTYNFTYPAGTLSDTLPKANRFSATPLDPDAEVTISDNAEGVSIVVKAPNGDYRNYVIVQEILLSDEARLKMIYLDSVPLRGFSPDVTEYVYIIEQGGTALEVTAEVLDTLADISYGAIQTTDEGYFFELDGVAQDGSIITYKVIFNYSSWKATPDITEHQYLFYHVPGTNRYKAVTTGINVQLWVYDMSGHRVFNTELPTVDPNDVNVIVDQFGQMKLENVLSDSAAGAYFEVPNVGVTYFYCFFNGKTKRIAKGGKFRLL